MLPNFLIVGAAKSGTTSLYHYLSQHPQIFMSEKKEPRFFALENVRPHFKGPGDDETINRTAVTTLARYEALFSGATTHKAVGEASTLYLYDANAPRRIKGYIPDAKIIVVLRNPIDRAYASYWHLFRDGRESLSFPEALTQEQARIADNWEHLWHYRHAGFYYQQLTRFLEVFDHSRIRIYLQEDLQRDPLAVLTDVFRFLDVDDTFVPPNLGERYNASGMHKDRFVQSAYRFMKRPHPIKNLYRVLFPKSLRNRVYQGVTKPLRTLIEKRNLARPPRMDQATRSLLIEGYRQDILALQQVLGRDLSHWLD